MCETERERGAGRALLISIGEWHRLESSMAKNKNFKTMECSVAERARWQAGKSEDFPVLED